MNRGKLLYLDDKIGIVYWRGNLYSCNGKENKKKICKLPLPFLQRFFTKIRWIERLLRLEPRCCERVNEEEFILTHHGFIYRFNSQQGNIVIEHTFRVGMNNPLSFLNVKNVLYYGEYFGNSGEPVGVFKRELSGEWHKIYEFPAHTINHIHNIIHDEKKHRFLILTGDKDAESGFYEADELFNKVVPLVVGSQKFRSCQAFILDDGILYATDTPLEQNYVFFMNHDGSNIRPICKIDGPCIYGTECEKQIYLSTTVEPDSNLHGIYYLSTYKRGEGVKTYYSKLYCGNENGFREIESYQKDFLPMAMFGFGTLTFPRIENKKNIFINGVSLKKIDYHYWEKRR